MAIIQKRADELKPGDVLIAHHGRHSVLALTEDAGIVEVTTCELRKYGDEACLRERTTRECDVTVYVEAPDLTPAQQHAEDLADALDWLLNDERSSDQALYNEQVPKFRALLDKIKPPEPPTLRDLAYALDSIDPDHMPPSALAALDRARRAGVI